MQLGQEGYLQTHKFPHYRKNVPLFWQRSGRIISLLLLYSHLNKYHRRLERCDKREVSISSRGGKKLLIGQKGTETLRKTLW